MHHLRSGQKPGPEPSNGARIAPNDAFQHAESSFAHYLAAHGPEWSHFRVPKFPFTCGGLFPTFLAKNAENVHFAPRDPQTALTTHQMMLSGTLNPFSRLIWHHGARKGTKIDFRKIAPPAAGQNTSRLTAEPEKCTFLHLLPPHHPGHPDR